MDGKVRRFEHLRERRLGAVVLPMPYIRRQSGPALGGFALIKVRVGIGI